MDINYFTCTLGQAALPYVSRPFRDVNHLVAKQAAENPDLPAVGFYVPNDKHDSYESHIITFREVQQGILSIAHTIAEKIRLPDGETVGLLCNSSPAFLFTWLGLIRLGHPVLLIAPQCSASAIAHLSKACNASILFHDEAHEKLAQDAVAYSATTDFSNMASHLLPAEHDEDVFQLAAKRSSIELESPKFSEDDVAYLHHTSGTSSGIPKPIPQTHHGGVAVLPALDGSKAATFSTTPLYHGGVADLFRSWSSSAMIWLFPSQHVPITAANVVKCLLASAKATHTNGAPCVTYFSSVPYVLQMMAQDTQGLKQLQGMDMVGVGGAALPPGVGNELVNKNVNLVSRYGSAECGFLMSSHRDYAKDKDWQYLRKAEDVTLLNFEKQDDGQSELVVLAGWPHMAKTNREDGSFATSDLFAPHPTTPNAWRYHSRADSQLTLITGKKFDPSPVEGSLAASSSLINEVLVFGNGKPYPGALLFRSEAGQDKLDAEVIQQMAPIVEKMNADSQSHARIPRNMLVPMSFETRPLDKSSKGTILRGKAEDKFREHIEEAYSKTTFIDDNVSDEELPKAITKVIESVVGDSHDEQRKLTPDTDLFAYGVDSVACIQVRHALGQLISKDKPSLPLTIVEDSGTISRLSDVVLRYRRGEIVQNEEGNELIGHLVDEYSSFGEAHVSQHERKSGDDEEGLSILLTGPTGLLGAHVLSQLLSDPRVKKIYLLIRGATPKAAKERVLKSLASRLLSIPPDFDNKVVVLPCKLADSQLGLSDENYQLLLSEVDLIFHLAWSVNFLVSLRSLASTHLAGLQNLLSLGLKTHRNARLLFCSSVASVSNLLGKRQIPEEIVDDHNACGSTGYAQSKLAAELICHRCTTTTQMRDRITVLRVGQLSGDTENGVWNMSEAYPLMLGSAKTTGVLPDLKDEILGWLPVDIAGRCFIEAGLGGSRDSDQPADLNVQPNGSNTKDIQVFNLLNTSTSTNFSDLTQYLKDAGVQVRTVPVDEWLNELESLQQDKRTETHPALKLLSFWKKAYGSDSSSNASRAVTEVSNTEAKRGEIGYYETTLSRAAMPSLESAVGPLDAEYVLRLWRWVQNNID